MPDHLHALLSQENATPLIPRLVAEFKKFTSPRFKPKEFSATTLWRDGYDDVPVPGREAAKIKIEYTHNNPVRKGIVEKSEEYKWSSVGQYYDQNKGIITLTAF